MASKSSKSAERIEKAKKLHGLAEAGTDSFLRRLADHPYTLWIVIAACVAVVAWVYW